MFAVTSIIFILDSNIATYDLTYHPSISVTSCSSSRCCGSNPRCVSLRGMCKSDPASSHNPPKSICSPVHNTSTKGRVSQVDNSKLRRSKQITC